MTVWTGTQSPKWLRTCRLLVGKDGDGNVSPSTGLSIDSTITPEAQKAGATAGIRITFDITKTSYRTPNVATIKIYNLNQTHENMVMGEFNDVILMGGYQGSSRLFFRGNIKYANAFREGFVRVDVIGKHVHAKPAQDRHQAFTDLSGADNTGGLAVKVKS